MSLQRFHDKVVIVTGAGSGIGAATARRFWAEGASVVLAGRTEETLAAVAEELDEERSLIQVCDVAIGSDGRQLVEDAIARFGRIDVLVNNAGTGTVSGFLDMPFAHWHRTIEINLDGVFNMTRAVLPSLLDSRGAIVNVSSVCGSGGDPGLSAYNASKGAVTNLTRSLALEFVKTGLTVNAVCPSFVDTPMVDESAERIQRATGRSGDEARGALAAMNASGRFVTSEEVAAAIAYLCHPNSRSITGACLTVDGGTTA